MAVGYPVKPADMAGVSIMNGAVEMEVEIQEGPRKAKRPTMKTKRPAMKVESSDDSDAPLVSLSLSLSIRARYVEWRHSMPYPAYPYVLPLEPLLTR